MAKVNLLEKCEQLNSENFSLRKERTLANRQIINQSRQIAELERQLSAKNFDISCIPPIPMTKQVYEWVVEYSVPWEILYCETCKSWYTELDSLFPYGIDNHGCKCDEQKDF